MADPKTLDALLADCGRQWPEYEWRVWKGVVVARHDGEDWCWLSPIRGGWRCRATGWRQHGTPRWLAEESACRRDPLEAAEAVLRWVRPERPDVVPPDATTVAWWAWLVVLAVAAGAGCVWWLSEGDL